MLAPAMADTVPNDTMGTAETTTAFAEVVGTVDITAGTPDIYDWYVVSLTGTATCDAVTLPIDVTGVTPPCEVRVYMPTDQGMNFLVADMQTFGDGTITANFNATTTGDYYIEIEGGVFAYDGSAGAITAAQANPGFSDNNAFATADVITTGSGGGTFVDGQNYVDIYTFTTSTNDIVDINVTYTNSWGFQLFDSSYNDVTWTSGKVMNWTSGATISFTETAGATYYLALNCPIQTLTAAGAYTYDASIEPPAANVLPVVASAAVNPTSLYDNVGGNVAFSCDATDANGMVVNVTVACSNLWTGERYLTKGTGNAWSGTFNIPADNISETEVGNQVITFKAYDDWAAGSEYNTSDVNLTIELGNRAPELDSTPTFPYAIELDEDDPMYEMDLSELVVDEDEINLTYEFNGAATFVGDNITVKLNSTNSVNMTITLEENGFGMEEFTVNASDADGLFVEFNVTVDITSVNDIPEEPGLTATITDAYAKTILEKENLTVAFEATQPVDADGETNFTYKFDFDNDGTVDETVGPTEDETVDIEYTYPVNPLNTTTEYTVVLTVVDAEGGENMTEMNVTVIEPPSGPEVYDLGFEYADLEDDINDDIEITFDVVEMVVDLQEDEPEEGWNTVTTSYKFSGTCSDDVVIIHIYYGSQLNDDDFTYYKYSDPEDYMSILAIEPEDGEWEWEYETDPFEYEVPDPVDDDDVEPTDDVYHMWYAAIGWDEDNEYNIAEKEYAVGGDDDDDDDDDVVEGEYWAMGVAPADIESQDNYDSAVTVTITEASMKTELNGDKGKFIYTFKGTCSEDVTVIHLYSGTSIDGAAYTFYPFREFEDMLADVEVTPTAGAWEYTYTYEFDVVAADDDDDGEAPEMKTYLLAVGWAPTGFGYDDSEMSAPSSGGDDDDDDDSGIMMYAIIGIIALVVIVLVVVVIIVLMKKKKAPAEEPAAAGPVMCACGAEIPAGSPTCAMCGAPAPAPAPAGPAAPVMCACGAQIPEGSPTCTACGAPAPAPAAPPMEQQQYDEYGQPVQQQPTDQPPAPGYEQPQPGMEQQPPAPGYEQPPQPGMEQPPAADPYAQPPAADPYAQPQQPGVPPPQ
jgi:hypothetical protein